VSENARENFSRGQHDVDQESNQCNTRAGLQILI
jgi:hypothetical protein